MEICEKKSVAIIQGEMGSGKSTLLRNTALKMMLKDNFQAWNRVPVLSEFHHLQDCNWNLNELIRQRTGDKFKSDVKYALMLDGIDELKLSADEKSAHLESIISQAKSMENVKVIITSRKSDASIIKRRSSAECKIYEITPVTSNEVAATIERICKNLNVKNKVLSDLRSSELYKSLPRTPLAASLLARLISENNQNLPSNLTELYSKFTELALGRWDNKKGLMNDKEYEAANSIVCEIAKYVIENQLFLISCNEAKGFFNDYLKDRNLGIDPNELFTKITGRCDIFYVDNEKQTFCFKHRTFAEYFYAKKMQSERIKLSQSQYFDIYYTTVGFFYLGLEKDCPEILTGLAEYRPINDKETILKLINFGNMILAGYKTKNSAINHAVKSAFEQIAELFISLTKGEDNSVLSRFSEMQILSLLKHVVVDSYGYEFFENPLKEAMISVSNDTNIDDDTAAVMLFLLNAAQKTQDSECWFESLASARFKNQPLRLSIQLAVSHESKSSKISNKHIIKIQKGMKTYRGRPSARDHISKLYNLPVNKIKST